MNFFEHLTHYFYKSVMHIIKLEEHMLLIKKKETPSGWSGRNSPTIMNVNEFFSIYDSSLFMSSLWSVPYALLEELNGKLPRIGEQWTLHLLSGFFVEAICGRNV